MQLSGEAGRGYGSFLTILSVILGVGTQAQADLLNWTYKYFKKKKKK